MLRRLADDVRLLRHKETLTTQYGDKPPWPLEVQTVKLPAGREALLILGPPEAREPLVLVLEADGGRAWTKEMPLVGVFPGVHEMAILSAAEGGVALAFCDPEGKLAALRHWDADGGIVADYEVVDAGGCAALSAAHWPGHGMVLAVAGEEGARTQIIDRQGGRAWGRAGVFLPWQSMTGAPVSIAPDGDGLVLLQVGALHGTSSSVLLAMRYDGRGSAAWGAPHRVGPAPAQKAARVVATSAGGGVVRVQTGGRSVVISADGNVSPLAR
ncbi:uncharacterized protein CMC5_055310 [Chondromyces crocatus]|uniref:Exo-alpha-sialidase n=2 Tax=Chondromyces crocatus TaxID=52 RepID=A0A0K1EL00_CHOCO|nr:uncharacterized protein CMC5_055310 [Chondromyces crocatus]